MKIVIFTVKNHIYANKIIKELLFLNNIKIVGIVESDVIYSNKSKLNSLVMYLRTSGFYYVIHQLIKVFFFQFGSILYSFLPFSNKNHILFPYNILARGKNIYLFIEKNINTKEFVTQVSKLEPDLFVSLLFNQLFSNDILSIPRLGTINFHPALLPYYRGVSPTFWALANGESRTGVTIHSIINHEIDKGEILAQKEIKILSMDTESSLYWRCVNEGIILLKTVLVRIEKSRKIDVKPKTASVNSSYFSLPTKKAVLQFRKNGRKFFRIRELFYEK